MFSSCPTGRRRRAHTPSRRSTGTTSQQTPASPGPASAGHPFLFFSAPPYPDPAASGAPRVGGRTAHLAPLARAPGAAAASPRRRTARTPRRLEGGRSAGSRRRPACRAATPSGPAGRQPSGRSASERAAHDVRRLHSIRPALAVAGRVHHRTGRRRRRAPKTPPQPPPQPVRRPGRLRLRHPEGERDTGPPAANAPPARPAGPRS